MNDSERLAEKYGLPAKRRLNVYLKLGEKRFEINRPLNRDIEALSLLALENDIWYEEANPRCVAVYVGRLSRHRSTAHELYADYPSKLDALCEALTKALLAA